MKRKGIYNLFTELVATKGRMAFIAIWGTLISTSPSGAQVSNPTKFEIKKAKRLHTSLTGTSPSRLESSLIIRAIRQGRLEQVSRDIIESRNGFQNSGAFYNVTVKDFATPWSSEDGSVFTSLNDMTGTVVGYTRDELPFNEILWRDTVYKAIGVTFKGGQLRFFEGANYPSGTTASTVCSNTVASDPRNRKMRIWYIDPNNPNGDPTNPANARCRLTDHSRSELRKADLADKLYIPKMDMLVETNLIKGPPKHYRSLENQGFDMSDREVFKNTSQLVKLHRTPAAVSGLMSLSSFGSAFLSAGTNRAAIAFSMKYFFCKDMEELNDTTIPDFRNRRDVDRSPGGESSTYKNRCVGCHAGMDALAGAFAYYDWNDGVIYEDGQVVKKMNHNVVYSDGFVTNDDSWINLWDQGQNATLGWGPQKVGRGVKELGQMFSETKAFRHCMAKQVFEKVCFRKPASSKDLKLINENSEYFQDQSFNMKKLFIKTSIDCMDEEVRNG